MDKVMTWYTMYYENDKKLLRPEIEPRPRSRAMATHEPNEYIGLSIDIYPWMGDRVCCVCGRPCVMGRERSWGKGSRCIDDE